VHTDTRKDYPKRRDDSRKRKDKNLTIVLDATILGGRV